MFIPENCTLCPRACGVDRRKESGVCLGGDTATVASASPHHGEERCLSGNRGSGTVFFSGCSLGCHFCQNYDISSGSTGEPVSVENLANIYLSLQEKGVHNLNLVTPTHYRPWIQESLKVAKEKDFSLPVIWNTSGYETLESVESLKDDVDIWLSDLKFFSPDLSNDLANAPDYFEVALPSLKLMCEQTGEPVFENGGILKSGVIVRLLVLPGYHEDAIEVLENLAEEVPKDGLILSLMRQYSPPEGAFLPMEMMRELRNNEFQAVAKRAKELGFASDFFQ